MTTAHSTPLADVRDAIAAGALSRSDIAQRTGLSQSTVDAAIEFLERTGRLRRERLASSCAAGSCAACALAHPDADGQARCELHGSTERGPVALVLSPTHHN